VITEHNIEGKEENVIVKRRIIQKEKSEKRGKIVTRIIISLILTPNRV